MKVLNIFFHRKRADTHENALARIEGLITAAEEQAATDKEHARVAIRVLTEDLSRIDLVHRQFKTLSSKL